MPEEPKERGVWAELYVRDFLSLPFISEFVLRSPQTLDGTQKEVADFLVTYPGTSLLISQKTQKDPLARNSDKTLSWASKEAKKAASQLCGALRTARGKPIWCDHPRRGRVELPNGLPKINHGIVLLEVLQSIDLNALADDLPLEYQGTPITYLSLNDFLNIAIELRTMPEVLSYLDARHSLPEADLRTIGNERPLFQFYLLEQGSLARCIGKADALLAAAARQGEFEEAVKLKWAACWNMLLMNSPHAVMTMRLVYPQKRWPATTRPIGGAITCSCRRSSPIWGCANDQNSAALSTRR
jgi:hypothetical protein